MIQAAVKAEAGKVLAGLDRPHPEPVTVKAVPGVPGRRARQREQEAGMVVPGSRGVHGFIPVLPGLTAGQVIQHAHRPVVIVWPEDRD